MDIGNSKTPQAYHGQQTAAAKANPPCSLGSRPVQSLRWGEMCISLLVQFQDFVQRSPALAAAARVGIAVSGGADSVALARLAHEAQKLYGWTITLLHIMVCEASRAKQMQIS